MKRYFPRHTGSLLIFKTLRHIIHNFLIEIFKAFSKKFGFFLFFAIWEGVKPLNIKNSGDILKLHIRIKFNQNRTIGVTSSVHIHTDIHTERHQPENQFKKTRVPQNGNFH